MAIDPLPRSTIVIGASGASLDLDPTMIDNRKIEICAKEKEIIGSGDISLRARKRLDSSRKSRIKYHKDSYFYSKLQK